MKIYYFLIVFHLKKKYSFSITIGFKSKKFIYYIHPLLGIYNMNFFYEFYFIFYILYLVFKFIRVI
jgi:hypothetical protein